MTIKDIYHELVAEPFLEHNKNTIVSEMEMLFLLNSHPKLKILVQKYKEQLFHFHYDEIRRLKKEILNIKKEQVCSHSNQSQTPK